MISSNVESLFPNEANLFRISLEIVIVVFIVMFELVVFIVMVELVAFMFTIGKMLQIDINIYN